MEIIKERKKCTKCANGVLDTRVPRGLFVKVLLFWLPLKRYRCNGCWKKTYFMGNPWVEKQNNLIGT
jgi:hypothetical protein